ncbi:MAG: T9SS type A sorting domain-containing protein [Bacteroidetes bacterium]|nr:T9SS type A sorting domain-containing protein [Bacteroidota bacterium]
MISKIKKTTIAATTGAIVLISTQTLFAQNLILNYGFNAGTVVSNQAQVNRATNWEQGCGRSYLGSTQSYFFTNSADLIDDNSTSASYDEPYPNGPSHTITSQDGDGRFVAFSGRAQSDPTIYPYLTHPASTYGESVKGSLTAPLNSCLYKVSFWAAGKIHTNATTLNNNLVVQAVLRKGSDCNAEKIIFTTPIITSLDWQYYEGTFALSASEISFGYDKIEFRIPLLPLGSVGSTWALVDNTSLTQLSVTRPDVLVSRNYCQGSPVTVSGSFVAIATNHVWKIEESDVAGVVVPGGYSYTSATINGTPGPYTFPASSNLPCNRYYKISLSLNSPCGSFSGTQVIYYRCQPTPVISSSEPNPLCFGETTTLSVNYSPVPLQTSVVWSTGATTSSISVNPPANQTFSVTVTDRGCSASTSYTVTRSNTNNPGFTLTASATAGNPYFTASATPLINPGANGINYYWDIVEIDPSTGNEIANTKVYNPQCWWNAAGTTSFQNYNYLTSYTSANNGYSNPANFGCSATAGRFESNHTYRVTRATWTATCPWTAEVQLMMLCPTCRTNGAPELVVTNLGVFDATNLPENMNYLRSVLDNGAQNQVLPSVSIAPNPSLGLFTLSNLSGASTQVEVYNLSGQLIHSSLTTEKALQLDLTAQPAGLYLCRITANGHTETRRMVIE